MEAHVAGQPSTEALFLEYASSRDPRLRDQIIERHEGLIRSLARKFVRPGVPLEDLVQCGWVAVVNAFDRFDPSHGTKFSTYAVHCVVGEIRRYFRDKTWSVKVPRQLQEISTSLNSTRERLFRQLQREPTVAEMAEAFHVTEELLLQAMDLGHAYQPVGLDERRESGNGTESMTVSETHGGPDAALEGVVEHAPLQAAIRSLDERKQKIVRMRFFEGCSQQEIADELGLSQMHISRLERTALKEMRTAMASA